MHLNFNYNLFISNAWLVIAKETPKTRQHGTFFFSLLKPNRTHILPSAVQCIGLHIIASSYPLYRCNRTFLAEADCIQCFDIQSKQASERAMNMLSVGFSLFNELNYRVFFDVFCFIFLSLSFHLLVYCGIVHCKRIHFNEVESKRRKHQQTKNPNKNTWSKFQTRTLIKTNPNAFLHSVYF